jgi:hypothetical protein
VTAECVCEVVLLRRWKWPGRVRHLLSSRDVGAVRSVRLRRAGQVAGIETIKLKRILVGKPFGKRPLGSLRRGRRIEGACVLRWEMDATGSGSWPAVGCRVGGTEPSGSATRMLRHGNYDED